ncbi:MAG TPA: hypothetical protein DEH25_15840 [Chloroflexi bacterium]|nr:hypothetical protein [Chloroflexota bacterium]HBY06937.1 hypothetical protein [Chloroflexota bacterium]
MYEDQNPFVARAMEYLEIAARYVLLNFLWVLSIFPVAAVFFLILRYGFGIQESPWVLIFIPIALASPATGGLYYATNQLAHGNDGGPMVYWKGLKTYLWPSYRWGIMNIVVAFLFSVNIWFYSSAPWSFAPYVRLAFIIGAIFWAAIQMYTFPFIIEQDQPSLKMSLRNSFLAVARQPLRSFGFLLLVFALAMFSTYFYFVLWVVVTVSLIAYFSNKNTLAVLKRLLEQEQKFKKSEPKE